MISVYTLSVLQRISDSLGHENVSYNIAAISTPASAASLSARVSEAYVPFVTWSSFCDDQHIKAILSIVPQIKMIKPPCEGSSSKLA